MSDSAIDYVSAPVPVCADLPAAHRRGWDHLARPGRWWTGAERVAIATEVRAAAACPLCHERKQALSPNAVTGTHAGPGVLPPAAVEAVHRITTDPGRLSRGWLDGLEADGLSDGHYVELVGVVTTVVSIDSFCRGLGVPLHALPEPEPGEPSRARPDGLVDGGAWVPMTAGRFGNVLRAMSLVPEEVSNLMVLSRAHYLAPEEMADIERGRGALDRAQVELVAARVSALRECFY